MAQESKDETHPVLERKQIIETEMDKILDTMKSVLGQEGAQDLYLRVQKLPHSFLQDERPLCRQLAVLVNEHLQFVQQIKDQNKINEYTKLSHEEIVHKLIQVERSLSTLTRERKAESCDVYIFGGEIDGIPLSISKMYQVECKCWKRLPDLPTARWSPTTAVHGTKIYVLGGFVNKGVERSGRVINQKDQEVTTAFEAFDWNLGTWECLEPIPQQIEGINCSVFHQSLLVWGTENNCLLIFKFNVEQRYWQSLPLPPNPQSHTLVCDQTNGRLIYMERSQGNQAKCLMYDLNSTRHRQAEWTQGASALPLKRAIEVCQIPISNVKTSCEQCVCVFSLPVFPRKEERSGLRFTAAEGSNWPACPVSMHNVYRGLRKASNGLFDSPATIDWSFFRKTNDIALFNIENGAFTTISLIDDTDDCQVLDFQNGIVLLTDKVGCKLCFLNCQTCLFIPMTNQSGENPKNFGGSIIQLHDQHSLSSTNQDMPM